jgi:hypothetical protein
MATITAVNILTSAVEVPKYVEVGNVSELYTAAVTTALASGDIIVGPVLPAGCFLVDMIVDTTDIDSGSVVTFTGGYASHTADWIASSTLGQTGGIVHANVAGALGFTATTNTTSLVTFTNTPGTAVAGTVKIGLVYTASP